MKKHRTDFIQECFDRGLYWATPCGEVWSSAKRRGFFEGAEKRLRPYLGKRDAGYYMVALCLESKVLYYPVHQVVWVFHKGAVPEGAEINHKNCNKTDNSLANLEITDRKGNAMHAYLAGRFLRERDVKGRIVR